MVLLFSNDFNGYIRNDCNGYGNGDGNVYEMITKWSWNIMNVRVVLQILHYYLLIGMMAHLIKIYNIEFKHGRPAFDQVRFLS